MIKNFRRISALVKRDMKEIVRDPVSLGLLFALPLAMEVLFYFIFHGLTPQFEMNGFAPSMIGFAHAFLALFAALLVSTDRETAFVTRLYTTPVEAHEFVTAYELSVIPLGMLQAFLTLLCAVLIDGSIISIRMLYLIPACLLSIMMFASLGILAGSLFGTKAVGGISSILITGQSVLSGMWFPPEGLPEGFVKFMNVLPFRSLSELFRNIITGETVSFDTVWKKVIILAAYTVGSFISAALCFRYRSKESA